MMDDTNVGLTNPQILSWIAPYLSTSDFLKLRPVCKAIEKFIGSHDRVNHLRLIISDNADSMQAIRDLSATFQVKTFRFEHIDIETGFLGDPPIFRRFSLNHCPHLKEILIEDCKLGAGRFVEMLAFCKKLKTLMIVNSPDWYRPEMNILQWSFAFPSARKILNQMTALKLSEAQISNNSLLTLHGLAACITGLQKLNITTWNGFLPWKGLLKLFQANCNTLKLLYLEGVEVTFDENPGIEDFPELKMLRLLSIYRISSGVKEFPFLEKFLEKCSELKQLSLKNVTLGPKTLSGVIKNLSFLDLRHCPLLKGTFQDADFPKLEVLQLLYQGQWLGDAREETKVGIENLMMSTKPKLESAAFAIDFGDSSLLRLLTKKSFPNISELKLMGWDELGGPSLRRIFNTFTQLKYLTLSQCEALNDQHLIVNKEACAEETLGNLKELRFLDLSDTSVGSGIITECITELDKLQVLNMDRSRLDMGGFIEVLKAAQDNFLPNLEILRALHCPKICPTEDEYSEMKKQVDGLTVLCNVDCSPQSSGTNLS